MRKRSLIGKKLDGLVDTLRHAHQILVIDLLSRVLVHVLSLCLVIPQALPRVMIQLGHWRVVPTVTVLAAEELHRLLWLLLREDIFQDLLRAQHRLRIL